ncbi:MAG: RNA 2',3'-cyclic phosphodiesterase [Candidatus Aenigmarchaeota archaeon]|nr:RNA 2',3'-cyclic phosphodiesterase [Candidatus Aenigmarchaeota archaeon]
MRTFVAIPIPEEIKRKIADIQKSFDLTGIKLVEPQNFHLTVKFFGDLNEEELERAENILRNIRSESFDIRIGGINVFPSKSYIRTIWIDVTKNRDKLIAFLKYVRSHFEGLGKDDKSEIIPHLTIGRVKWIENKQELLKRIEKLENVEIGEMKVDKLVLYKSTLTRNGPIYEAIGEINFG